MSQQLQVETDVQYPGLLQPGVDDAVIDALKSVIDQIEMEELTSQDRAVQEARKRELYWQGIQALYWNEVSAKYEELIPQSDEEAQAVAKIVNVYKADGEAIAAAVGAAVPTVRFYPSDADDPDDILTAKAETKLSEKIAKDNEAPLLLLRTIFTLWKEPFAAAYINYVEDPSFGYRVVPTYDKKPATMQTPTCAVCGSPMGPGSVLEANNSNPLSEEVDPAEMMPECPDCGSTEITQQEEQIEIPQQTGEVELPEGRATIEIYGISNVRIPFYCRKQEDLPYIFLDSEQHYSMLRDIFPHIKKKIISGMISTAMTQTDYRRPIRSSRDAELATCRRVWLRPWVFEVLDDDTYGEEKATLKEKFPDGILAMFVNDVFAGAWPDGIDKSWVFTKHPMSEFIHNVPLGDPVLPLQDMTNEGTNLSLDLILNSVPPTFVNPDVVSFKDLRDTRQLPGSWVKARPKTQDVSLDKHFYTPKPPTMSQYLPQWFGMLDARRQHVGGALPSIYGGAVPGSGGTKGEYEQSKGQALQRLSIIWKMLNVFWPKIMEKAVRIVREEMTEDIRDVRRSGNDFVNVWIRKSEMTGKVGRVVSESSEEFPVAWSQIRGLLMELMGLGIPQVNEAILHPENADFIKKVIGVPEMYIPGEDDRRYQLGIIQELLMGQPMVGPMGNMPSIQPDDIADNDICIAVTQAWLMSEQGLEAKDMNPGGYANVLAHLQMRLFTQQQQQMAQAMAGAPPENTPQKGSPPRPQQKPPSAGPPAVTQ